MREGWEIKPLKEFCNNYKQDIVDGPFGANLKREHYANEGIPVLKIQNIKPFHIELKKMDYVSSEKAHELQRHGYTNGDIIITKLGLPLGAAAIVRNLQDGIIVADLVRVRAQKIDTQYLCYHLNSPQTNAFLNSQQGGATRPRVQISAVRELPIAAPSLPEQKRIVAILDKAFEGIDRAIANTEKNLANSRELFESYLNAIFTQKGDGWVEKKLGNLSEVQSGGTPLRSKPEYWGGQITWYSSGELNDLYTTAPERNITDKGLENSNAKLFPKGSLLIGMYDTAALKMSILDRTAAFNQAIAGVKPNDKIDLIFILHAINFVKPEILSLRRGVRQKNLSLQKIKDIVLAVPELQEQQGVVRQLASMREETQRLEAIYRQKIAALKELKQSILQKAFTGKLTAGTPKTVKEEIAA